MDFFLQESMTEKGACALFSYAKTLKMLIMRQIKRT